jgi:hypothetical protein
LSVVDWIPLEIPPSEHTHRYLKAKKDKLGHKLKAVFDKATDPGSGVRAPRSERQTTVPPEP